MKIMDWREETYQHAKVSKHAQASLTFHVTGCHKCGGQRSQPSEESEGGRKEIIEIMIQNILLDSSNQEGKTGIEGYNLLYVSQEGSQS